jgi:hypothetical protein
MFNSVELILETAKATLRKVQVQYVYRSVIKTVIELKHL